MRWTTASQGSRKSAPSFGRPTEASAASFVKQLDEAESDIRGAVHFFENTGTEDATALAVVSPGLLGPAYFRELAVIMNVDGPPDFAAALEVMRRHGLTPA